MTIGSYVEWYGRARYQGWQTPRDFYDRLNEEYHFDLDGASDGKNSLCEEASTAENPIPWIGRRVFCNPPWSDIAPFVEYAVQAELAVLLVPARTNARWFHRALELGATVKFFKPKPRFVRDGVKGDNSPVDCVLLVFERRPR